MLNKTTNDEEKNSDLAIDHDNGCNDDYTDNTDLASLVHALYVGVQHLLVVLRREKAILAPRIICLNILLLTCYLLVFYGPKYPTQRGQLANSWLENRIHCL